ncbi:MAG: hypothetical protein MJD61_14860 [Proteobacteria bacterium]|nr:hypothetical protein [Pseudomonadota bacterium]
MSATVWARAGQHGDFYSVTIQEHFQDASDGDKWKSTKSISADRLGNVPVAVMDAQQWIARKQRNDAQARREQPRAASA